MVRARKNPGENRGGRRQGAPGGSYPNRSDLRQAPRAVPGQTYGQAGQQLAAQQAIPLPRGLPAPAGGAAPGGQSAPGPGGPPTQPLTPIDAPTMRPGEPLTTGIASGPGAGPEALTPPNPLAKAAAVLNLLGHTADPQTAQLRARINAMLGNQGAA